MAKVTAYIGLGSNLGRRGGTLRRAVEMLGRSGAGEVKRLSDFIRTAPEGGPPRQGPYLNAAVELETNMGPLELLEALQGIERALGRHRAREERWGPRACDLDILLMGELVMDSPRLMIPHPRMHQRLFVLRPLAQIAPRATHPVLRKTVAQLLAEAEATR
jgi:2-amino-4-hydroxy-6-hydroxymethyldihydropteridine diphosphokinase